MKPLHTKYRPKEFSEIIGNKQTVSCIESMLKKEGHPTVFLLVGKPGCGKTTLARIIAKNVKCSKHSLLEINAADDRGIETGRAIIQMIKTKPLFGKSRCIIIDEAQRMTRDLQESLLKALEEPPEGVYFVLCTTDPQKIITTIKDQRCSEFELNPLKDEEIKSLLQDVCKKEKLKVSEEALDYVVEFVEGIPRRALTSLNKVIHLKDQSLKAVKKLLAKEEGLKQAIDLCRAIISRKQWTDVRNILKDILKDSRNDNLEQIRQMILGYVSSVALNSNVPNKRAMLIYECFKEPFYTAGKAHLTFACLYCLVQK